ncbi:MAG: hypothetical protein C4294_08690 [Nitrospiraceae bacterium]
MTVIGALPKMDPIPVYRNSGFCGDELPNEALRVEGRANGVEGAMVSLEGITRGKPLPQDQTIIIESRGCRFVPRVNATVIDSLVVIQSTDPIMHSTHIRKNSRFGDTILNVLQLPGSKGVRKRLTTSGVLDVRCDIHPFMRASVHVFEHPYFSITDAAGRFELTQVPPGTYRLRAWHETLGIREQAITVPVQGPVTVDVELDVKKIIR